MLFIQLVASGLHGITSQSAQKVPCKKIEPFKNCVPLRFAQALQLTDPHTRLVVAARSVALFGLADLGLGKCKTCQRLAMQPSLF